MIFYTTRATLLKDGGVDHRGRPITERVDIPIPCFVEETFIKPVNDELFSPLALISGAMLIFAPGELVRDVAKGDMLELDEYPGATWVVKEPPKHYKIGGWHTEINVERST